MDREDWKKGAGYGAIGLYTMVAGGQVFVESKDVLEQLCFTAADCNVKQDMPAHGSGGSRLNLGPQIVATSTASLAADDTGWPVYVPRAPAKVPLYLPDPD